MKVSAEIDFHKHSAIQMRDKLEHIWSRRTWHGLQRVRVIHGKGEVLIPELRRWCEEKGIDWSPEPGNPGATLIFPGRRTLPSSGPTNRIATPELRAFRNKVAANQKLQNPSSGQPSSGQRSPGQSSSRRDLLLAQTDETGKREEYQARDAELFEAEISRLESEHARSILRNKHSR